MSKDILYTKYNSMRAPEYQVKTTIIEEDGRRYVVKSPMCDEAAPYMQQIRDNYDRMKKLYDEIRVLPAEATDRLVLNQDGVSVTYTDLRFDYLKGEPIAEDVDYESRDIFKITEQLKKIFERIFDYNYDCMSVVDGEAYVSPANIDAILSNFITVDDEIWCLDYEWMTDEPTPIRYIEYRSLLYLYSEQAILRTLGSFGDFVGRFGYDSEDITRFNAMEEDFQQKIHGESRKYAYLPRYAKNTTTLAELIDTRDKWDHVQETLDEKDEEIRLVTNHINRIKRCMKDPKYAFKFFCRKVRRKMYWIKYQDLVNTSIEQSPEAYEKWIRGREAGIALAEKEIIDAAAGGEVFSYNPKISVIIPVYNVADKQLRECIESVIKQKYTNWELCLSDDCSTMPGVKKVLEKYRMDKRCAGRIQVAYRTENGHISKNSNTAMSMATGDFFAFLDCDDTLADNAFFEAVKLLNEKPELDFIYSDEDKIDETGRHRRTPFFKPDWSPDLLMSLMYTCHLSIYRKSVADTIAVGSEPNGVDGTEVTSYLDSRYNGAQDYDFALRFTEAVPFDHIGHIPMILYHWRERAESTASAMGAKPYVLEATKACKEAALKRRGLSGTIEYVPEVYQYRPNYHTTRNPKVSIIIPSKDNYSVLLRCVESLKNKTTYKNYEIILVDNGSDAVNHSRYSAMASRFGIDYLYQPMPFNFSHMCNVGAEEATGRLLLFLNDDTEIIDGSWLDRMVGQAELDYAGAVGAKLLYPGGQLIQHTGVLNIKNGPSHALAKYPDNVVYYFDRNRMDYNYLAVTAACVMIDSNKYWEVGGFNEDLAVAYNDMDLCMKLTEAGYYNVVRNDIVLIHHESVSRGSDNDNSMKFNRLQAELKKLYALHPAYDGVDPFYNPNLISSDVNFKCDIESEGLKYDRIEIPGESELEGYLAEAKSQLGTMPPNKTGSAGESKDAGNNGQIVCKIERCSFGENIEVDGYIYERGDKKNNEAEVKVLFLNDSAADDGQLKADRSDGGRSYIVDTRRLYRPDVETKDPEELCMFSGFICREKRRDIARGRYKIGIIRNGRLTMTGTVMEI